MKKLLPFTLIFFSLNIRAQISVYHPLLDSVNIWTYTLNYFPVLPQASSVNCSYPFNADKMYTSSDTVINSVQYKQLFQDYYSFSSPCLFGYVREDTSARKVYFQDVSNSAPVLLYNFGMQIGDTIQLNSNWPGYFQNGYYRLDSIGNITIAQGIRNVFYLNCHTCSGSHTLSWIESVGNLGNAIYPYSQFFQPFGPFSTCPDFPHDLDQFLTCFQHIQKVYYDSCAYQIAVSDGCFAILDTCEYYNTCGSVSELPAFASILISPNPFHMTTVFTIKDIQFTKAELIIYDAMGRMVHKELIRNQSTVINRNSLGNGIYFYLVTGNGKMSTGKFVVE